MTRAQSISEKIGNIVPTRYWLAFWTMLGSTNLYAMRVNLNVAIVAMAMDRHHLVAGNTNHSSAHGACPDPNITTTSKTYDGEFDWDEETQGIILSSFFWGYIVTQFPGGRLAEIFSAKWLFGMGVFSTAFFTLLTPLAARLGVWYLVGTRIIEGLLEGVTYPAIYTLFAKWSPPLERTQMYSFIHLGVCVGTIIASPISGLLIVLPFDNGWPLVFYFFGSFGVLWFIFWIFMAYDSPALHPRISPGERDYIINSINQNSNSDSKKKTLPVPWRDICLSLPFWSVIVAHFGFYWGFNTLLTQLPTYLKSVLRFNMKSSAFLSALPYLGKTIVTLCIGYIADFFRRRKYLTTRNVRRVCNSIGNFIPAAAFIAIPFVGCDKTAAMALLVVAASCHAGCNSGFFTSHVDLSPNFAGTLMGISNTIATIASICGPYFVGYITKNKPTTDTWATVFYVAAAVQATSNVFYIVFISGDEQYWNNPKTSPTEEGHEKTPENKDKL